MKQLFTLLLACFSVTVFAQVNGDFRSKQSGDWSSASTWEVFDQTNLQWNNATSVPTAANSVWIQDGDSLFLTANGVCKDLHVNAQIDAADSARIFIGGFTLAVHGKLRTYSGAKVTGTSTAGIPGTNSTGLNNSFRFIVTTGAGKLQMTGTSHTATATGEWGVPLNFIRWRFEVAMNNATDTVYIKTNFRAGAIVIAKGIVVMDPTAAGALRPDSGSTGTGSLTIGAEGSLLMNQTTIARIAGDKFGTFDLQTGGSIVMTAGTAGNSLAAVTAVLSGTVVVRNSVLFSNGSVAGSDALTVLTNLRLESTLSLPRSITVNGVLALTADNQLNLNSNTLTYGPFALVEYAGTAAQLSSDIEYPSSGGPSGFIVNNAAGVTLHASRTVSNLVRMVQGALTVGANAVTYGANATLVYNGIAAQTTADAEFPTLNGPNNLAVNDTNGVTLHAARTISGMLSLINGTLNTTSTNILTLTATASTFGGGAKNFVNGPLNMTVASVSSTARTFPIGKASTYRPVTLTVTQNAATATTYTAEMFNTAHTSLSLPSTLSSVSTARYYNLTKGTGANIANASVTLNYGAGDGVTDSSLVRVARANGANWDDVGGTGTASNAGSITSTTNFTALGDFVLGTAQSSPTYPYPVVSIDSIQFVNSTKLAASNTLPDYVNPVPKNSTYGDTVQVEGIVLADPRYYGLSINRRATFMQRQGGGAWSGIEVMCDQAATYAGFPGGQSAYMNATQFNQNSTKGLKVRYVGVVRNFNGTGGSTTTGETQLNILPYPAEIVDLNPVTIAPTPVTVDKFMKSDGSGGQLIQIPTGEQYEGVYVELNNVTVVDKSVKSGNRWNWSLMDGNGNKIYVYDFSAYMRNDNLEDTVGPPAIPGTPFFTPPNNGVTLSYIRGVITEIYSSTTGQQYVLNPLLPADIGPALAQAPVLSNKTRTPVVASSSNTVTIACRATDDSSVVSAKLYYAVGISNNNFTQVNMTMTSGTAQDGIWSGTVPAQANGSFVKYYITATDNGGHKASLPDTLATGSLYQVIDGGLTSISQIQSTPLANGSSIWNNDTLTGVSIRGIVTATAATNDLGFVTIQDGTNPHSGIYVKVGIGDGIDQWKRGDSVVINSCVVREDFNVTTLFNAGNSNHVVAASGKALPAYINTLNSDSVHAKSPGQSEPYEGMLLQFDTTYIINKNADAPSNFGEFAIGKDSALTVGLRVDDQSNDIPTNFNTDSITLKEKLNYIRGILYFSFGNWKLLPRNRADIAGHDFGTSVPNVVASNIQFTVYPNPARNSVNLRVVNPGFDHTGDGYTFTILDITGREMKTERLGSNVNVLNRSIDVSDLKTGLYFCRFSYGNAAATVKLVITN